MSAATATGLRVSSVAGPFGQHVCCELPAERSLRADAPALERTERSCEVDPGRTQRNGSDLVPLGHSLEGPEGRSSDALRADRGDRRAPRSFACLQARAAPVRAGLSRGDPDRLREPGRRHAPEVGAGGRNDAQTLPLKSKRAGRRRPGRPACRAPCRYPGVPQFSREECCPGSGSYICRSTIIFLISAIAPRRVQALRTGFRAIHDRVAAIQAERIFQGRPTARQHGAVAAVDAIQR